MIDIVLKNIPPKNGGIFYLLDPRLNGQSTSSQLLQCEAFDLEKQRITALPAHVMTRRRTITNITDCKPIIAFSYNKDSKLHLFSSFPGLII
ncbi:MAG: hypothetical protein IIV58_06470 [Alistipes sp.]|nr:hypothetical protein [Alistipes sp.]